MSHELPFDLFIARLRRRDKDATTELFDIVGPRTLPLIARLLRSYALRPTYDALGVLDRVVMVLLPRLADGRYAFGQRRDLTALLCTMSLHCVSKLARKHRAERVSRAPGSTDVSLWRLRCDALDPALKAERAAELHWIQAHLTACEYRMLYARMEGRRWQAIAVGEGRTPHCVRKICERALLRLRRKAEQEAHAAGVSDAYECYTVCG